MIYLKYKEENLINDNMKNICMAEEGCKTEIAYTLVDHRLKKEISLCKDHFKQGMKAWFEPDPILKALMHKGIL